MSRLAAAFLKASAEGQAVPDSLRGPSTIDVEGASSVAQAPWDIDAPRAPEPVPSGVFEARTFEQDPPVRSAARPLHARANEAVATLVRRIFEPGLAANRRRAVLFSGVDVDATSSSLTATVAVVLSGQTSGSICLVDADFRSPSLHKVCGRPAGIGLSDMLVDGTSLPSALTSLSPQIWLLAAGGQGDEARRRLTSEQLRPCVEELRERFDYLVVNAAPIGVYRDASILGPLVDGIVLMLAASGTRREAARRSMGYLEQVGATVLGAVLADRTFPIPEALYRRI